MTKMKYLWTAVLVALCLGLGSGAALAAAPVDSWDLLNQSFPESLEWDQAAGVSVNLENDGTSTWNHSFGLVSVEGITTAASPIDRWGFTIAPVTIPTIAPTANLLLEFTITAPPITSLQYDLEEQPTGPPMVDATAPGLDLALDCNWILAHPATPTPVLITTDNGDTAINPVVVSRFPDIEPGTEGGFSRFWVEELSGRVPEVVLGYDDGTYRPAVEVTRDQMAVYIARALKSPLPPFEHKFSDIDSIFWARPQIEALADQEIVLGYDDGTYRPTVVVTRDQMAAYISRGMVGGDENVPSGPAINTFPDVPVTFWAFKYIEFAVDHGVTIGFPDGTYGPALATRRDQMATFIWRAFVMPTGAPIVLAGPAVTEVDPEAADYVGYTSVQSVPEGTPLFAYVGFDAVRLGFNLLFPASPTGIVTPTGTWDIQFELFKSAGPTAPIFTKLIMLGALEITAARQAALETGDPYWIIAWSIKDDLDLPTGIYTLVTSVADETGDLIQLRREFGFIVE